SANSRYSEKPAEIDIDPFAGFTYSASTHDANGSRQLPTASVEQFICDTPLYAAIGLTGGRKPTVVRLVRRCAATVTSTDASGRGQRPIAPGTVIESSAPLGPVNFRELFLRAGCLGIATPGSPSSLWPAASYYDAL